MSNSSIQLSNIGIDLKELKAVEKVLLSEQLRQGKVTEEFETAFTQRMKVRHAIAVNSGTAALHIAYLALLEPGDEVLVPAFTFISTASMVAMTGAVPIFCDIDPLTWTIDPEDLRKRITKKTKAIAPVHLFGNSCDINALISIAKAHQLKIIWDCAQSLGTKYMDKEISEYPDVCCFSFYPSKMITTGEGGMITTNDDKLAKKARLLREHGRFGKYEHSIIGFNYRMPEMAAAMGLIQLEKLDLFLKKRHEAAQAYLEGFSELSHIQAQKTTASCLPNRNYFSLRVNSSDSSITRDRILNQLKSAGIPTAVHYPKPLHLQDCFSHFLKKPLPESEKLSSEVFSLPMHPFLDDSDISRIVRSMANAISFVRS